MRVAVTVECADGQVVGITSDEVLRIGKDGVWEFDFHQYKLRITVDPQAQQLKVARVGALPWPCEGACSADAAPTR